MWYEPADHLVTMILINLLISLPSVIIAEGQLI